MPCYDRPTGPCSRGPKAGTVALNSWVLNHSPSLAANGIYACRPPRGAASGFSAHAEGRAFDVNAALSNGHPNPAPVAPGSLADQAIRRWITDLIAHHTALGVQRILYKNLAWRCDLGWHPSTPSLTKLHQNHMHVEQTRLAALTLTTAQIRAALEEDDMFTDADRALVKETRDLLLQFFGTNPDGSARDIRAKIDANYVGIYGDDHPDLLAGRVAAIEKAVIT